MSVRLCCVSVIGLRYILCMLQHFYGGGVFSGHGVVYSLALGCLAIIKHQRPSTNESKYAAVSIVSFESLLCACTVHK